MTDRRAKELFLDLLELPEDQRGAELERRCGADEALRGAVLGLLRAHGRAAERVTPSLAGPVALDRFLEREAGAAVAPGRRIDAFVIGRRLGEGGFGIVHLAEQTEPVRRRVALKVLRPGMESAAILARFEAERQALARMDHPNICKVHDAGTTPEGLSYFVMEYVEGEPLVRYCDEHGLSLRERLRLFGAVCEAVQHAHQKGVVHRDLKPSNVLVATVDGRPTPKVIDFGVAKAMDHPLTETPPLTLDGQFLGTPAYMSPEQASGAADVDTRSDVYSLGAMLYELLCGRPPFDAREVELLETLRRIREDDPPRPSRRLRERAREEPPSQYGQRSARRAVAEELDWIAMRCLQKEPARRYPTAAALHADLERFLRHQPVEAAPPSRVYQLRKLVRRHRVLVASSAAVFVALSVGAIGAWAGLREANRARAELADALEETELEARRAREAERVAADEADEARRQGRVSEAVVAFLTDDLLAAVEPSVEPGRGRDVGMREVLDVASARLEESAAPGGRFASEPAVEAALRDAIGEVYRLLSLDREAEPHLARALEIRVELYGSEDPLSRRTASRLAAVLRTSGRGAESEALIGEHHDLEALDRPALDVASITAAKQIALLRQSEGRHAEAAEAFERALAAILADHPPAHPQAQDLRNGLAVSCAALGRFEEAERLFRENAELAAEARGAEDPETLGSALNLGAFLLERGRLSEAEEVLAPVAEAHRRVLGEDHRRTTSALLDLAILRREQGRLDESARLLEEVLAALDLRVGPGHPDRLQALLHLSRVHVERAELDAAEALLLELRERAMESLPAGHPLQSSWRQDLAECWLRQGGREAEVEALLREALAENRRLRGPDDPATLRSLGNVAVAASALGRLDEAEDLLREALERSRRAFGPDDPETLRAESDLAVLLLEAERPEEALELAAHAAESGAAVLDADSQDLALFRLRHASSLCALGRYAPAERELLESRRVFARAGAVHAGRVRTIDELLAAARAAPAPPGGED